jgi:hypothetical protein
LDKWFVGVVRWVSGSLGKWFVGVSRWRESLAWFVGVGATAAHGKALERYRVGTLQFSRKYTGFRLD